MKLKNSISIAFDGMKTNKTRSVLTTLGIIIGVAAVIGIMSIGEGVQNLILGKIQGLGSGLIMVVPGNSSHTRAPEIEMSITTLDSNDVNSLLKKNNVPFAEDVMPSVSGQVVLSYLEKDKRVTFTGSTSNLPKVSNIYPEEGRFFTEEEDSGMARVVVLGLEVKEDLFGDGDVIGENIKIERRSFKVIGVMEEKGTIGGTNLDSAIYIPLSTAQKQLLGINHFHSISIKVVEEEFIDQTIEDIASTLRINHDINDSSDDDFTILSQKEFAETVKMITDILKVFLSSVAAISLIVGGIGIMNIMLVSVRERTREIGIRKSFGATRKNILMQFLLESIFLTLFGGILGIIFGALISLAAALIFSRLLNESWGFVLSLNSILLGVGVSAMVGLVFGIYPAKKAASLSPIEALRYE